MSGSADASSRCVKTYSLEGTDPLLVLGHNESNLKELRKALQVQIVSRGQKLQIRGSQECVDRAITALDELSRMVQDGHGIGPREITYALETRAGEPSYSSLPVDDILLAPPKRVVKAKTHGQKLYVKAIREHDVVFSIGPAGTGKTYLAVAMALSSLESKRVRRIILVRPAVEAGESLGFLPGDMKQKVDPYLRPLYDALYDMMSAQKVQRLLSMDVIEILPLAYMRGRTLNDSFIILDEAQNTSPAQMKMFLTRLGFNSKAVITGDITQIDLPQEELSGLVEVQGILDGVEGLAFVNLDRRDVIRHPLVQSMLRAYEAYEASKPSDQPSRRTRSTPNR
jgi:phosphate starvation-inducible PhoH-like protein